MAKYVEVRNGKYHGPQSIGIALKANIAPNGKVLHFVYVFFIYLAAPLFQEYVDREKNIPIGLGALFLRVLPSYNKESIRKVENKWCGPKGLTLLTRSSCLTISTLLPPLGSPLLSNLLRSGSPIPKFWYMN